MHPGASHQEEVQGAQLRSGYPSAFVDLDVVSLLSVVVHHLGRTLSVCQSHFRVRQRYLLQEQECDLDLSLSPSCHRLYLNGVSMLETPADFLLSQAFSPEVAWLVAEVESTASKMQWPSLAEVPSSQDVEADPGPSSLAQLVLDVEPDEDLLVVQQLEAACQDGLGDQWK